MSDPKALEPTVASLGNEDGNKQLDTVLVWFRRDLRVADNPALTAALQAAKTVIPVYVWAPEEEGQFQAGRCSRWWIHNSLAALEKDLQALGSRLIFLRASESTTALTRLLTESHAQALFFNHLYDPISLVRDNEVKAAVADLQVHCQSFNGDVLYEPWEVLSDARQPLTSFASFWDRCMSMPYQPPWPLPVPSSLTPVPDSINGLDLAGLGLMSSQEEISNDQLQHNWTAGGRAAHLALQGFVLDRLSAFDIDRAKTDRASTSRLSPHIHMGEISVRHIYFVVRQQEHAFLREGRARGVDSCRQFMQQMGYREYARYLSFHFPFTHERSLLEHLCFVPWRLDQRLFKAWRQGCTGFPLVDAGMRQLWSTGWLHNRSRVVCASFLVKNLLLPWQWGLKHYWDALLDADLECDALGWQYCSGCLVDAHPFTYLMDHAQESERFDPDGNYVRRWLPVLARLPKKWIHRPWEAPAEVLADADVELGANYPAPIISVEESYHCLQAASRAVYHHSDWPQEACKVPYRPAPFPPSGHPSHPSEKPGLPEQQMRAAGERVARQAAEPQPDHYDIPPQPGMTESDEEVVSNSCYGSVLCGSPVGRTQSVRKSSASVGPRQPDVPESAPEQRPHVQHSTTRNGNGHNGHHLDRDTQATGPQDTPMDGTSPRPSKRRHVDSNQHGVTGSDEPGNDAEPVQMAINARAQPLSRPPSSGKEAPCHEDSKPNPMNGASSHKASNTDGHSGGNLQERAQALLNAAPNTGHRSHGRLTTSRKDAERLTSQLERFLSRGPLADSASSDRGVANGKGSQAPLVAGCEDGAETASLGNAQHGNPNVDKAPACLGVSVG
ncbi:hypothetical protein WJX74_009833 [Apatococcus lobatus]|uniref:Photolyase/cryptochrome alpha/beta domain-containing protein n=1 Tax=Apatococcus lobatus TaxID=904363 RepID=A0AAW1Q8N3_9CHLO